MRQPALDFVGNGARVRYGIRESERSDFDDAFQRRSGRGRTGAAMLEGWNITAFAQHNLNLIVFSFESIVILQLAPETACFHANNGVYARIENFTPIEYLDADEIFLQPVWLAEEAFLDDELQEPANSMGLYEDPTTQNLLEFRFDVRGGNPVQVCRERFFWWIQ